MLTKKANKENPLKWWTDSAQICIFVIDYFRVWDDFIAVKFIRLRVKSTHTSEIRPIFSNTILNHVQLLSQN